MNRVFKIALACFASNMLFLFLFYAFSSGDAAISIGMLWIAYIIVQLIVGFIMSFQSSRRHWGNGILLGVGVGMLVGFSVCSGLIR